MKVYLNKEYKCVKVEDNTFVANDSSNYIRYYFVTNANGDVIDKMDDTSVIYRNTEPSYVTVAFRRADGDVIQHLMASPKTDATGKSFFEYEITNTDGVLYKKGALEISAQFIEATLSETGGVKKVISQKVKAIAINTAHVLDNIGEEAEEYYSQYEQANNDAHAVLQTQITTNFNNIGTLQELTTDAKDDLVKAINEVDAHADANKSEIGDLSNLTTDEKTTIVGAINEVDQHADENKAEIGNLSALTTDEKATLVGAINEVDNHADNATTLANNAVATANGAVATANEAKTTAQTAENNANSAVDKANDAVGKANEAIMKADAKATSIGFMTAKDAVTALNGYPRNQLKGGDTIWIVEDGTPDLWVTEVAENSVPYNYTTKDKFNQDLVDNKVLQIGYFKTAYQESDGKPVTIAWQNVLVKSTDWVASTEFADFPYEAKIELTDFVDYTTVPQVVFDIADTMSGNYAPICKSGDKCVYIYGKVQDEITLKTVITFAPNVNGASVTGGGYNNRGKWVASTTYAIDDLVYTDNGQYVCIEGITSTTSPEQDTTHWQATFVATGKTKNTLTISGQDNGTEVQKTFDGSQAVEVAFDETTMTAKEVNGVLKVGAKGTIPEALPQEASALKSGNLPISGWITPEQGWKENTLPADSMWWSVIYGNGKFVAVARDSTNGAYSMDGITWTEMLMPASRDWQSVTYGNDKFVAVASGSANGAYSTDGINWTEMTLPASRDWQSVTYGDGKYVAVADGEKGAYSTDGITWTQMSMSTIQSWQSVTYGDGKFVAVAYNSKKGAYSTDGITWTEMTLTAGHNWRITYGNDKFVAVAVDWQDGAYSTDGITWTKMFMPESKFWSSVTYGDGKFVAVASDSNKVAYSTDGINWTGMTLPAGHNGVSVAYGDGKFVVVSSSGANGAYLKATADITYTISDASITANSDILMELTDDGGVKSYSMEAGKITVIRDTVPTQPIPYTYKIKQTNASGQFTLVNHFVPSIPVTSVNGQTGAVTIAVPTKTSQLTNDSNFATTEDIPTSLPVTYKKVSGSLPTTGWATQAKPIWTGVVSVPYYEWVSTNIIIPEAFRGLSSGWEVTILKDGGNTERLSNIYNYNQETNTFSFRDKNGNNVLLMRIGTTSGSVGFSRIGSTYFQVTEIYNTAYVEKTYTISDTSITANTSVKMYLTDEGGVKAQSKASGSITVIRDEVPTTAIPYEYEVEQTSADGLFEVINAYVPAVPTKTSQLTNDSGFAKTTEANTWTGVQTFSNADGIKTDRVHNLDNNDAWYNFDGANNRFGSPSRPTIIRTSEARPRAQVPSGETTVTKEIALLEDVQGSEWAVNNDNTALPKNGWYLISNMVVESYQLAPFIARVTARNNKLVIVTQDLEGHDVTLAMTIGSDRKFADAIRVHTYTIANNTITATSTSLSITTLLTDGQFSFDYKLLY